MARLAQKAGIPDGVINVVPGYGPTAGAAIVKHPGVDKVAFTGEYKTAQIIMKDASQTLKRLTFELGGKSPNIIFADADLDAAAAGTHFGLYLQPGTVLLRRQPRVRRRKGARQVRRQVGGHEQESQGRRSARSRTPSKAPQVDKAQFDKIMHYVDLGKKEGAKCVTGGKRVGDRGYFIEPTLFDNVTDDMSIAKDEIFGPVMIGAEVQGHRRSDRARQQHVLRAGRGGLDPRHRQSPSRSPTRLRAGTVWVNCYDVFDAAAPFGGFKMSGIGRELGEKGLEAYTENKTVTVSMD